MTGMVLEGGAMRGLFTAGVLDVMLENGVEVDGVIGVSAGAVFGCNYKSRQIGRVVRYNKRFCRNWRYCSFRSLLLTGDLYGAKFCYETLPKELDLFDYETYRRNPVPFYVTCTDVDTGEAVYHRCDHAEDSEMEWYRASASMPLASCPVRIGGRRLLDGGIADSIPVRYFETLGYERNIIILTQPEGFVKKPVSKPGLIKRLLWRMPRVFEGLSRRHEMYNETIAYIQTLEAQGQALVIRPPQKLEVGYLSRNPEALQKAYDLGRAECEKRLMEICAFIGEKERAE